MKRTHNCGILKVEQVGERVGLQGWVQTRRDHGGVIFIDLRDRSGVIQLVFNYEDNREVFNLAERVRSEYVLAVEGDIVSRSPETVNPKIPTGEIEVMVDHLEILNPSKTPPFYIEDGIDVDENLRLRYRYLDLRRP
ncbi:MAG: aspartate--tRNA ligase, partial [Tindallia sp. MSAO_Bac2]